MSAKITSIKKKDSCAINQNHIIALPIPEIHMKSDQVDDKDDRSLTKPWCIS